MAPPERDSRPLVLCADDDPTTVASVSAGLGRRGWRVSGAADSMQAMMFAVREVPDIMVLDLTMPGGDGNHVLLRMKKSARTAGIPVVILSGSEDPRAPARALRLGAEAFLPKPVDIDLLEATLEAVLGMADRPDGIVMAGDEVPPVREASPDEDRGPGEDAPTGDAPPQDPPQN